MQHVAITYNNNTYNPDKTATYTMLQWATSKGFNYIALCAWCYNYTVHNVVHMRSATSCDLFQSASQYAR